MFIAMEISGSFVKKTVSQYCEGLSPLFCVLCSGQRDFRRSVWSGGEQNDMWLPEIWLIFLSFFHFIINITFPLHQSTLIPCFAVFSLCYFCLMEQFFLEFLFLASSVCDSSGVAGVTRVLLPRAWASSGDCDSRVET